MIVLDPSEDRFHNPDLPGSYEWTYFDGLSQESGLGFSAIWFRGIPMSPWYSAAIDRRPQAARPDRYCAFAFGLYDRNGRIASGLEEGPESLFSGDSTGPDVRFRGNSLYASKGKGGETGFRITLDIRRPLLQSRVQGEISFRFPEHHLGDAAVPYVPGQGTHFWVPAAPNGYFDAAIDVTRLARSPRRYRFQGRAYHDRNFGFEPLQHLDVHWHWGRFHFGEKAFVFFDVFSRGEGEEKKREEKEEKEGKNEGTDRNAFRRLMLFDGGRLIGSTREAGFTFEGSRNHWATLPYPSAVAGADPAAALRFTARTRSLLDSGPFYHRIAADFELLRGEEIGAGTGMTEYLRPSRLGLRIFRPFVKFRVRRVEGK